MINIDHLTSEASIVVIHISSPQSCNPNNCSAEQYLVITTCITVSIHIMCNILVPEYNAASRPLT